MAGLTTGTSHFAVPGRDRLGEPPWDMAEREQLVRAKAAELVTAGATSVREESYDEHLGHVVMLDPERNAFCIA